MKFSELIRLLEKNGFKLLKELTPAFPNREFLDVKHLAYSIEYQLGTKEYEVEVLKI